MTDRDSKQTAPDAQEAPAPARYTLGDLLDREALHVAAQRERGVAPATLAQLAAESRVRFSTAAMFLMPRWAGEGGPWAGQPIPEADVHMAVNNLAAGLRPLLEAVALGVHPHVTFGGQDLPGLKVPYATVAQLRPNEVWQPDPATVAEEAEIMPAVFLGISGELPSLAGYLNFYGYTWAGAGVPAVDGYLLACYKLLESVGVAVEAVPAVYMDATKVYPGAEAPAPAPEGLN